MRVVDLIEKKRLNQELNDTEIKFLIEGFVLDKIKDYQMSAFAMAVMFNSMSYNEVISFTKHMMHSGRIIDLSLIKGIKVDKHSTGGIGDKTSIAIAPIIASLNIPIAKMSGRGLGFTGGTLDKLESISGFDIHLTEKEFIKQVNDIKISIIGQTNDLVLADKKLYSLRDATSTVASVPLIASSIMSKKLALGADIILLDVKVGSGAFMKDLKSAIELAQTMILIGKKFNRNVKVVITNMNRPIGKMIGNKNEVLEAIALLKNQASKDFTKLVYSLCQTILQQAKVAKNDEEALKMIEEVINNGKALHKFKEFVKAQKGNVNLLFSKRFWNPQYTLKIKAKENGFLEITESLPFGLVAMKLGAGRETKEDLIDNEAGIELNKKTNDKVQKGDTILSLYSSTQIDPNLVANLEKAIKYNPTKIENKIILERL